MKRSANIASLLFLLITACSQHGDEHITTRVPLPIIGTLSPVPSATMTATITPTADPERAAFVATKEARAASMNATLVHRGAICEEEYRLELPDYVDLKSNDFWTIFTCTPKSGEFDKRYTIILSSNHLTRWEISFEHFQWADRGGALLVPYRWSTDGDYVYLISSTYPGSSGFKASGYLVTERALYRFNLKSGVFETILPENGWYYAFSISSDDRFLAFANPEEESIVHILDLLSREDSIIDLGSEYVNIGAFVWTKDSKQVVFAAGVAGWLEGTAGMSIFRLSPNIWHNQLLVNNDFRLLIPYYKWEIQDYWIDEYTLNLFSLKYDDHPIYFSDWSVDIRNGTVVQATPTPRP